MHDLEQPWAQVGAVLKSLGMAPGALQAVLHQFVGAGRISGQGTCKAPEPWNLRYQLFAKICHRCFKRIKSDRSTRRF